MEKHYEITEKQLVFLEDYIRRKKRYSNPEDLHELIDHLISDFEATTKDGNLSQYLGDNSGFIYNYNTNNTSEAIHWSYQRQLFKNFFSFFYHLKYIPFTILYVMISYTLIETLNINAKSLGILFFVTLTSFLIYGFFKTYHKNKKIRKLVSFKYLANVMSLPSLFLYMFSLVSDFLKENIILFFLYFSIALGLHVAGILLIYQKRKEILKKHKHLLN